MKYSKYHVVFTLITVLQIMVIIFWGTKKENLYWDEFYTLERAHYFSDSNPVERYIDADPDFRVGEWMPVSFVKDTLVIGEKETLFNESIFRVLYKLTSHSNYSAYLNLMESVFSPDKLSIWPSIILNIIFFILNQIVLFAMCKKLSGNEIFPLAVCSMYGFSSICVSMTVFIRFYMLVAFFVTLFTYLHLLYYEVNGELVADHVRRIAFMVLAFGILYLAHNNAQYSAIYGAIFVVLFSICLLMKKGIKYCIYYILPMFIGGFTYLYTQTDYIKVLLNPDLVGNAAMGATIDGISEFNLSNLPSKILDMAHILGQYLFGSFFAMILFLGVAVIMLFYSITKLKQHKENDKYSSVAIVSSLAALVYIMIFTAFGLYAQVRYISFVFPELVIAVMMVAFSLFEKDKYKYAIASALILIVILSVNAKGKVDMLYTGDKESIERIRNFDADSYLLATGNHMTFMTYETAFVADYDDEFYVYNDLDDGSLDKLKDNLRDKMILVNYYGVPSSDVQEMLKENGYQVNWIADTYNYVFYTVVRN